MGMTPPDEGDMSWGYRMISYVEFIGDPLTAKMHRIEGVKLAEVVFHYRSGRWVPDGGYRFVDEVDSETVDDLIDEMTRMMQATRHPVIPEKVLIDYSADNL